MWQHDADMAATTPWRPMGVLAVVGDHVGTYLPRGVDPGVGGCTPTYDIDCWRGSSASGDAHLHHMPRGTTLWVYVGANLRLYM